MVEDARVTQEYTENLTQLLQGYNVAARDTDYRG